MERRQETAQTGDSLHLIVTPLLEPYELRTVATAQGYASAHLSLFIEWNVGHLLAGVEEAVLGALAEDVLQGTHVDGCEEGGDAERGEGRGEWPTEEHEGEEGDTCDEEDGGCYERCNTPAVAAEDDAAEKHHAEGRDASGS